ncbi:Uncharacterised protein [Mycobacterium tuberculosis]|nr:Uncharacterised protein [Mycobacterium tuberculosis]CNM96440.1 Uncharacterised protein [Mycobacterium tuberculosis]CNV74913.1 Uncharacterised protein [Mycobacterium tuberculosis]CNW48175.1 Uncharacterised protein [Mycobacterium tuberculosis]CNZ96128.1 Uncharacterised protein [Mycobacterium tuberculosis]
MYERDQVGQHRGIAFWQHPVAEVEDMAGRTGVDGAASVVDNGTCGTFHRRPARQDHRRIEVAL